MEPSACSCKQKQYVAEAAAAAAAAEARGVGIPPRACRAVSLSSIRGPQSAFIARACALPVRPLPARQRCWQTLQARHHITRIPPAVTTTMPCLPLPPMPCAPFAGGSPSPSPSIARGGMAALAVEGQASRNTGRRRSKFHVPGPADTPCRPRKLPNLSRDKGSPPRHAATSCSLATRVGHHPRDLEEAIGVAGRSPFRPAGLFAR